MASFGCTNQSGVAPSADVPSGPPVTPPISVDGSERIFKYSQQVTTANNWIVQVDFSDSVESKVLPNAWTVEVLNE